MARYGKRIDAGFADSVGRVSTSGKNATIQEIVHVMPTSDVVTLYSSKLTAYGTSPTDVTTGAAILKDIKYINGISGIINWVTGAPSTTTAIRPLGVKIINGPTTLATIYAKGVPQGGGSGVILTVLGKAF